MALEDLLIGETEHPDPLSNGFSGYIQRAWNNTISNTFSKLFKNTWSALGTGVGKGILLTFGGMVLAGAVMGVIGGSAGTGWPTFGITMDHLTRNVANAGAADYAISGAYYGAKYALTSGLGWLAMGAAVGAAADVRAHSFEMQAAAAELRAAERTRSVAPEQTPTITPDVQQQHEFNPYQPHTGWADRTRKPPPSEGYGR